MSTTAREPAAGPSASRPTGPSLIRLLAHQIRYEQLSFWRNRQSAFFMFAFPVMFFVILGGVFGDGTMYDHVTALQYYTPTIAAMSVMGACYSQLAITLSFRRQQGILKRLRATPAPSWLVFCGLLAHCVIVSVVDVAIIVVMSRIYGTPFPHHWAAIVVTLVVGAAAFCALGVAVASLIKDAEAAPAVVQFVFFPLIFISGTYFVIHSHVLNTIADIFPVRPFNQALLNPFALDKGLDWPHIGVLALWGVVGAAVAVRRFRWDPRPE